MRGRELGFRGHLDSVGHAAADNTLDFLMTHLREATKECGGGGGGG